MFAGLNIAMSVPPISLVKSRENLQAIGNSYKNMGNIAEGLQKYEQFDRVLMYLWRDIKRILNSYKSHPPKYIIKLHDIHTYNSGGFVYNQVNISELIEILKRGRWPESMASCDYSNRCRRL